ncbi:hypothetical protein BH20ACT2_BH20ACT2_25480 [soil metagenome]
MPVPVPSAPPPTIGTIVITPWPDPVIDRIGLDPRSAYVEKFWLGILGPSTTWLIRRLATELEARPAGFKLDLGETARALGLGAKCGRHSPFMRALSRSCQFGLAQSLGGGDGLAVRRKVPPLNRHQVERLPAELRTAHQAWQDDALREPSVEHLRRRARHLALSLLELGEDLETTERQLHRWKFHPALAREASAWAWRRHTEALAAAEAAVAENAAPDLGGDAA